MIVDPPSASPPPAPPGSAWPARSADEGSFSRGRWTMVHTLIRVPRRWTEDRPAVRADAEHRREKAGPQRAATPIPHPCRASQRRSTLAFCLPSDVGRHSPTLVRSSWLDPKRTKKIKAEENGPDASIRNAGIRPPQVLPDWPARQNEALDERPLS